MATNLTEREVAVLHLLAEGKSNKQISANLYISIHTTKAHLESIYYKFGVNNRLQAVVKGAIEGFLYLEDIINRF